MIRVFVDRTDKVSFPQKYLQDLNGSGFFLLVLIKYVIISLVG